MASRDDAVNEGMDEEFEPGAGSRALTTPAEAFRDTLTVRSYEVGRAGSPHPATILRYLEHLATCASAALGFDNRWYHDHHSAWVVREMSLLLGDAPQIDDALDLATWVAEFRHVQATRDYLITRADSGRLVARASARWAYIHRERLLPTRIPPELTARMGPWGHAMRPRSPEPLLSDAPIISEARLIAREYEADSQQHINNCVYLDWLHEAAHQTAAHARAASASGRLSAPPMVWWPAPGRKACSPASDAPLSERALLAQH